MLSPTRAHRFLFALGLIGALGILPATAFSQAENPEPSNQSEKTHEPVCGPVDPGVARCHADIRTDLLARTSVPLEGFRPPQVSPDVLGNGGAYDPAYLQSAYNTPSSGGAGQTVAIID